MLTFTRLIYSKSKVRVRYAPSPTGMLHLGNLRTALFNYLFCKNQDGQFILRIQDTDQKRKVPGAVENIHDTLKWVGIEIDEGPHRKGEYQPYVQSERGEIYREYLKKLEGKEVVYKCFCEQKERVKKDKSEQHQEEDENCGCSNLPQSTIESNLKQGKKYAIKLKSQKKQISFDDAVYKKLTFPSSTMKDFVLLKNDGFPTYHFANVVDDISMKISHVFRGEEWITSTPKHIQLYKLFEHDLPTFVHLPVIQTTDRKKLSKRDKSTSVKHYIDNHYLPEAIVNSIALLGWSNKNNTNQSQIFSIEDLIKNFRIQDIHNYPAMFDPKQLQFFNNYYMKKKYLAESEQDSERIDGFKKFTKKDLSGYSNDQLFAMSDVIMGRIKNHNDIEKYKYLYQKLEGWNKDRQAYNKQSYNEVDNQKIRSKQDFHKILNKLLNLFSKFKSNQQIDLTNLANQDFHVLRFCLTGKPDGPNAIQICKSIGLKQTILRLQRYLQ